MSWVCRVCSTNNVDSSDVCFICGARRGERGAHAAEEDITYEEVEVGSEVKGDTVEKKHSPLVKAIAVIFPILAFAVGQILLYLLYAKEGKVLFLTRFISALIVFEFNVPLILIATSIAGGLSCILAVCNSFSLAARGKEFRVYFATLPYCVAMVLCPPISACWLLVLEFIGIFIRKRRAFIAIIVLENVFALITLIAFPVLAAMIG